MTGHIYILHRISNLNPAFTPANMLLTTPCTYCFQCFRLYLYHMIPLFYLPIVYGLINTAPPVLILPICVTADIHSSTPTEGWPFLFRMHVPEQSNFISNIMPSPFLSFHAIHKNSYTYTSPFHRIFFF